MVESANMTHLQLVILTMPSKTMADSFGRPWHKGGR